MKKRIFPAMLVLALLMATILSLPASAATPEPELHYVDTIVEYYDDGTILTIDRYESEPVPVYGTAGVIARAPDTYEKTFSYDCKVTTDSVTGNIITGKLTGNLTYSPLNRTARIYGQNAYISSQTSPWTGSASSPSVSGNGTTKATVKATFTANRPASSPFPRNTYNTFTVSGDYNGNLSLSKS